MATTTKEHAPGIRKSLGDFLVRVFRDDQKGLAEIYSVEKAAMSSTSGLVGGYLVPTELRDDMLRSIEEQAIVRPRALVVSMASESLLLPLPDATTRQTAGIAPYFGGISLTWTEDQGTAFSETEPTFRQIELKAWNLAGYALASNPLLDDARGLESFLRRLFGAAIGWYEDYAFLRGDGVGKPLGMLTSPAALSVTRTSANTFVFADAASMIEKLLPSSWPQAIWVMHPLALNKLMSLATTTTAALQANQPRQGDAGPVGVLHGLPVYVSGSLPALGTAGDVLLIDPSLYVIGDRSRVEVAVSRDEPTAFLKNQSVLRILARLDGRPWLDNSVRLTDGTNTVSPYIYLN